MKKNANSKGAIVDWILNQSLAVTCEVCVTSLPLVFFFSEKSVQRSNIGAGGIPIENELEVDWPIHGE